MERSGCPVSRNRLFSFDYSDRRLGVASTRNADKWCELMARSHLFVGAIAIWLIAARSPYATAQTLVGNEDSTANVTVVAMPGDTYTKI